MMRGTACALSLSRDRQPPSKTGGVPPELRLHEGGDEIIAVIVTFVQAQCQPDPRRVAGVAQPVRLKLSVEELVGRRSEEHTSELQSLMRISYAVFCLKK